MDLLLLNIIAQLFQVIIGVIEVIFIEIELAWDENIRICNIF